MSENHENHCDRPDRGLSSEILESVESTIRRFSLCGNSGEVIYVAASGGKDSTVLCMALAEVGYRVRPLLIDIGYSTSWAQRVRLSLTEAGFDPTVISANNFQGSPSITSSEQIGRNLLALDTVSPSSAASQQTPCTSCYNVKVLLLEKFLEDAGASQVAFGHHMTDALSSFLKSAFMYIDRWDYDNTFYDRSRFDALVASSKDSLEASDANLFQRVEELADRGLATTDEPPRQRLVSGADSQIEVIRPLFDMSELTIRGEASRLRMTVEPSGCGHTMSPMTRSPREIVQFGLVNRISATTMKRLARVMEMRIDARGQLDLSARARRVELLGDGYKPSTLGIEKL